MEYKESSEMQVKSILLRNYVVFLFFCLIISFASNCFPIKIYAQANFSASFDFQSQLDSISDLRFRKTLENSIKLGLIQNNEELQETINKAYIYPWQRSIKPQLIQEIYYHSIRLYELEKSNFINVKIDGKNRLFVPYQNPFPQIYDKIIQLADLFNPKVGTPEIPVHEKEIDSFLDEIKNDPLIKYALNVTNTDIKKFKANWFGAGAGFEHVFCGEIKGEKVSGYHWWYKYYADEERKRVKFIKLLDNTYGGKIFIGSFEWDPDGSQGPIPLAKKPKGGFTVGNSPQILLALGHLVIELARKYNSIVPASIQFQAIVNGTKFAWQMYTFNGTIRSLYPLSNSANGDYEQQDQDYKQMEQNNIQKQIHEYYELEEDCLKAIYNGSLTTH